MTRGSRAPFVVAGLIAAVPLLVLAAAAAGGGDWVWLEYPRHITMLAIALGIAVSFAKARPTALVVLAGTVVIALLWEVIGEYRGLAKFGRTDLLRSELDLLVKLSVARAAPWLVGGAYAVLAYLAIGRSGNVHFDRRRAALWLGGIALIALAITLQNTSWLTLENLSQRGTFRSSVAWPDTKKLSLVIDLVTLALAAIAFVYKPRSNLPKATAVKG
ncbi:MAG TPA: hypothetical protein VIV11_05240 [Kofleriaceae bacterium]